MYKIYEIVNLVSGRKYIGMTKNKIKTRWNQHLSCARKGFKTPLYDAMRSYGFDCFAINVISEFCTKQECCNEEIRLIAETSNLYNLARGGEGGFTISNIEEWKAKLKKARKGRQPALGMKHTEENRKFFSECSKRKPLKYEGPLPDTYKEAKALLGISKTHYYRLRRRAENNELG